MLTVHKDLKFTHPSLLKFDRIKAANLNLSTTPEPVADAVSTLDLVIERLVKGNQKFVEMRAAQIQRNSIRLSAVAQGQTPFAAILNYAQLTTSTEEVFDRKFGELFVINSPGQITNQQEISSIEYSTLMLGVNVVVVLGDAAHPVPDNAPKHRQQLKVAIEHNRILISGHNPTTSPSEMLRQRLARLQSSPILRQLIQAGDLKIIGSLYDAQSGQVTILNEREGRG